MRNTLNHLRQTATEILHQSLAQNHPRKVTTATLELASLDLSHTNKILVIAIGKAAVSMYEGAAEAFRNANWPPENFEAIVIAPLAPTDPWGTLTFEPGAHPIPTQASLQAARLILTRLSQTTPDTLVLFLISGGASAMVELPTPPITLDDLATFNRILVGSSLPIAQINLLRRQISQVKGGKLAQAAAPAQHLTLIVSDVPAGQAANVGSGPTLPSHDSPIAIAQALASLAQHQLPPAIQQALTQATTNPLQPHAETNPSLGWKTILSSEDLADTAAALAQAAGFHVEIDNTPDDWPAAQAAQYLLTRSRQLRTTCGRTCLISVGEVTVTLPQNPGQGGRNQHFALECALALAGDEQETLVLRAGTDGIDGNSPAAGTLADQTTVARARHQGLDPAAHRTRCDAYPLFAALNDAILTGPTGNNLRDLCLILT